MSGVPSVPGYSGLTEVGHGGFATVYRARDERFKRDVAVKVLTTGLTESTQARFFRECEAVGALSGHPNIVAVHDMGTTGDGTTYLVMEYLPGGTLAAKAGGSGLSWQDATGHAVALAGALESAHQAGILHRDVKPENVLFTSYGTPKLVDFGIATVGGGYETRSATVTASISHAAPEIIAGQRATATADVYSLASTLYFTLAGTAAFSSAHDETLVPLIARVSTAPVPDLRTIGVPDQVATAVEHGMAKTPADRPATAQAFADELLAAAQAAGVALLPAVVVAAAAPLAGAPGAAGAAGAAAGAGTDTQTVGRRREPGDADTAPVSPERGRRRAAWIGAVAAIAVLVAGGAAYAGTRNPQTPAALVLPGPSASGTQTTSPSPTPATTTEPSPSGTQPSPKATESPDASSSPGTNTGPGSSPQPTKSAKPKPTLKAPGAPAAGTAGGVTITGRAGDSTPTGATVRVAWGRSTSGGRAASYCVQWTAMQNGSAISGAHSGGCTSGTGLAVALPALHPQESWVKWQVRAKNSAGTSGWVTMRASVPNVVGLKEWDAYQKMRLAGIKAGGGTPKPAPTPAKQYVVFKQSPTGGTVSAGTSSVIYSYS